MTYYVELSREQFSGKQHRQKTSYRAIREKDFSRDILSPCMIAVFRVDHVRTSTDAIAGVMEHAAGFACCCQLIMGGRKAGAA